MGMEEEVIKTVLVIVDDKVAIFDKFSCQKTIIFTTIFELTDNDIIWLLQLCPKVSNHCVPFGKRKSEILVKF